MSTISNKNMWNSDASYFNKELQIYVNVHRAKKAWLLHLVECSINCIFQRFIRHFVARLDKMLCELSHMELQHLPLSFGFGSVKERVQRTALMADVWTCSVQPFGKTLLGWLYLIKERVQPLNMLFPWCFILVTGHLTSSHIGIFLSHPWERSWHQRHLSWLSAVSQLQ